LVKGSQSDNQYTKGSPDLISVFKVCQKALALVETKPERTALNHRLQYECRQAIRLQEVDLAREYIVLMEANNVSGLFLWFYKTAAALRRFI